MTTISVQEYVEIRRKELASFEAYWLKNQAEDPDNWPPAMDEGEWFEQEAAFGSYGERND